jgi:hypothetical protein
MTLLDPYWLSHFLRGKIYSAVTAPSYVEDHVIYDKYDLPRKYLVQKLTLMRMG